MNNLPEGAELLRIARETLLSELRPLLGADARYTVAMIANAMAIAARETDAGEAPARAALKRLSALYDAPECALPGEKLRESLSRLERRFAQDIRAGRYDDRNETQRAVLEHLLESVAARQRISNPKSLPHPNPSPDGRKGSSQVAPRPPGERQR